MASFRVLLLIRLLTTMSSSMFETNWTRISSFIGRIYCNFSWKFIRKIINFQWFECVDFGGCDRSGIQQRRSSWQDGVLGTNCPIPPKWNWTYQFQVKDQIGSFFYFPSLNFQRASGGYGGFIINNRDIIPIPFGTPDGDITIMIGDWYTRNHTVSVCWIVLIFHVGMC